MKIYRLFSLFAALTCVILTAGAQNQPEQNQEKREKQMMESIDNEVQRLSKLLELEYWQEFYVDSTLTHNMKEMQAEFDSMQKAKVENPELYTKVQDKWMEATEETYKHIFNEEQWKKYWKSGAEKAWKARQKRKK